MSFLPPQFSLRTCGRYTKMSVGIAVTVAEKRAVVPMGDSPTIALTVTVYDE